MTSAEHIPVIAATGEVVDRPADLANAIEPLALMEQALRDADEAAGGSLLRRTDSLDVVNQISWPYAAPAQELCSRLKIAPQHVRYGPVGGETPLTFLHAAAARIARGESRVAAICGGEAHRSVEWAARSGFDLPWTPPAPDPAPSIRGQDRAHPLARKLGIHTPTGVYPLFENALAHRWRQSPSQALVESAAVWARMSAVAAQNPHAWLRAPLSADDLIDTGAGNRLIAHPYRKLMMANIAVNQGAAVLLTSLAEARAAGLDDGRLTFLHQGFAASEPGDHLARDRYDACPARDVVLERSLTAGQADFDAVELYSCFPCVPKAARRTLGLAATDELTVAGGLTFFGGPLNNYMTHAVAAVVRRLRERPGRNLLYGQGGFATRHHALIVASTPPARSSAILDNQDVQAEADRRRGVPPAFNSDFCGRATIETYTVIHARDGSRHGVVIVRDVDGRQRGIARVPADDQDTIALLEDTAVFAIGRIGTVYPSADGIPNWTPA